MTRDEIIQLAREQGLPETAADGVFVVNTDDLGRMLAAEREACAKLLEDFDRFGDTRDCIAAIRARGEKGGA